VRFRPRILSDLDDGHDTDTLYELLRLAGRLRSRDLDRYEAEKAETLKVSRQLAARMHVAHAISSGELGLAWYHIHVNMREQDCSTFVQRVRHSPYLNGQ
jgi:hypothetical protein